MSREFNHDEKKVLFTIFEHLPATGDVSMFELQNSSIPERAQRFGVYKLVSDPELTVLSSLTSQTSTIFLTIAQHNALDFVPALSSIEKSDSEMPFTLNEYVELEDPYLKKQGKSGAVLVSPFTSPILLGFPEQIDISGKKNTSLLVVFINTEESTILHKQGPQSLIKDLLDKKKSLAM
jgi:hypothetical protein